MTEFFLSFLTGILAGVNFPSGWGIASFIVVILLPVPVLAGMKFARKNTRFQRLLTLFLFWCGGFANSYFTVSNSLPPENAYTGAPVYIQTSLSITGFPEITSLGNDGNPEYTIRAGKYKIVSPNAGTLYPSQTVYVRGWLYPYQSGGVIYPNYPVEPQQAAGISVIGKGFTPLGWITLLRDWTARQFLRSRNLSVRALLFSLITGNRSFMSYADTQSFRMSGILHLLALSGLHVAAVSFGIAFLLKRFMRERDAYLISTFAVIIYVVIGGFSPSLVRSGLMFVLYTFLKGIGRKPEFIDILVFSAFVLLLIDPLLIQSPGFVLSYLSTAAIVLINDPVRERLRLKGYFGNILSGTLSANIVTAPFLFYYFHGASLIAPLTNFLIVPYFGLILALLFLHFFFSLFGMYFLETVIEGLWWGVSGISDMLSRPSWSYIRIDGFNGYWLAGSIAVLFIFTGYLLKHPVRQFSFRKMKEISA